MSDGKSAVVRTLRVSPEGEQFRDVLMAERQRVHLGVRLAVRMVQVLSPPSVTGRHRGARIPAGLATDVAGRVLMTRGQRGEYLRLALECLETAVTTAFAPATVDAGRMAFMPTLNTCMEAGIEGGTGAVVVPAALVSTALVVRVARGHPVRPGQFGWPVMATVSGAAYRLYLQHQRRQLEVANDRHTAAIASQAFRAGQLSEATRADSVVDEVQHALVLVEDGGGPRIRQAVASWKASLVEAVRDEASYLTEVLLRWQALRNLDADMSRSVQMTIASDEVVLLSRRQATELWDRLDALAPAGAVTVTVGTMGQHLPGQALDLRVGEVPVHLPADPRTGYRLGFTPVAAALAAVLVGQEASPELGSVPLPIALSGAGAFLGLGAWAHRRLPVTGDHGRRIVTGASLAIAAVYTVVASPRVGRTRNSSGVPMIPAIGAIQGVTAFYGTVSTGLSRRQRQVAIGTMGAIALLGWRTLPEPIRARELLVEAAWPVAVLVAMTNLAAALDDQSEDIAAELDAERAPVAAAAYERGRRWVRSFCAEMVSAAVERLEARADQEETAVTREARRRIGALRQRLIDGEAAEGAPPPSGSSSWTTTRGSAWAGSRAWPPSRTSTSWPAWTTTPPWSSPGTTSTWPSSTPTTAARHGTATPAWPWSSSCAGPGRPSGPR